MHYYKHKTENELGLLCLNEPLDSIPEGYVEITQEQYNAENQALNPQQPVDLEIRRQIASLKQQLAETDSQAIKYAEGWISEQDYAPIKAQRQALRDQINQLEQQL